MRGHIRRRDLIFLVTGALVAAIFISPAGAHVGGTIAHLWAKHIKPKVTKLVYTEAESDARFAPAQVEPWNKVHSHEGGKPRFNPGKDNQGQEFAKCYWFNFAENGTRNRAGFYKDRDRVYLRGVVRAADGWADACGVNPGPGSDHRIFTLPVGYRPLTREVLTTMGNAKLMQVNVYPNGDVSLGQEAAFSFSDVKHPGWLSLDGLSFRAAP